MCDSDKVHFYATFPKTVSCVVQFVRTVLTDRLSLKIRDWKFLAFIFALLTFLLNFRIVNVFALRTFLLSQQFNFADTVTLRIFFLLKHFHFADIFALQTFLLCGCILFCWCFRCADVFTLLAFLLRLRFCFADVFVLLTFGHLLLKIMTCKF